MQHMFFWKVRGLQGYSCITKVGRGQAPAWKAMCKFKVYSAKENTPPTPNSSIYALKGPGLPPPRPANQM